MKLWIGSFVFLLAAAALVGFTALSAAKGNFSAGLAWAAIVVAGISSVIAVVSVVGPRDQA